MDATLVPAPKQRNTDGEKEAVKEGESAKEIWPDQPNKAAQKDTNARWTLKVGWKVRYRPDGTPLPQIALPVFGYKSHISIDRKFGFIRGCTVTLADVADGRQLRHVLRKDNTASNGDIPCQCEEVLYPGPFRACLCSSKEPLWAVHPHDRLGTG